MMLIKLDGYIEKNANTSIFIICTKCQCKWINNLNMIPDILNMEKKKRMGVGTAVNSLAYRKRLFFKQNPISTGTKINN